MDWQNQGRQLLGEFHPRKFFAGWLRSFLLAGLIGLIAFLNGAGPVLITLVIFNVGLLGFWVLDKADDKSAARTATVLFVIVGFGILGWSAWAAYRSAEQYKLSVEQITVLRLGHTSTTGEGQVTAINSSLDLGNRQNYTLYYKILRQYAKVKDHASSLENPGATVQAMEPNNGVYLVSPPVPALLENGKWHEIEVEYEVLYGRSKRLEKRFRYTAHWQFFLCPRTGLLCGDVTRTDEHILDSWKGGSEDS